MTVWLVAGALALVAAGVATLIERRRRPATPSQPRFAVPAQLDLAELGVSGSPRWALVLFTSTSCETCAAVSAACAPLASDEMAVREISFPSQRDQHERYRIDAVPLIILADSEGVVRYHHHGPIEVGHLWSVILDLSDED